MNHIDLFSGIGGFALAANIVWGKEYHNVFFCDNNKFCQEVIRKNFGKDSKIYGDIREVTRERVIADADRRRRERPEKEIQRGRKLIKRDSSECKIASDSATERLQNEENKPVMEKEEQGKLQSSQSGSIQVATNSNDKREQQQEGLLKDQRRWIGDGLETDLLTGGFPCQPFSVAGKRKGSNDDRFLWPEMFRVIKEFSPTWIVAENVRGILNNQGGVVFEQVCSSLESAGYEVQPFIIPAVAVNAPHRRDRVWIIAHCKGSKLPGNLSASERTGGRFTDENINIANSLQFPGRAESEIESGGKARIETREYRRISQRDVAETEEQGLEREISKGKLRKQIGLPAQCREWNQDWLEVATELCRVDDGFPVVLDTLKLSAAGHRVERLKSLGNAIVPQIATEIFRAIKEADMNRGNKP